MNRYEAGEYIKITAEFRDVSGTLRDPTTVIFSLRAPDGTVTTRTPTRASLGEFFAELTTWVPSGRWAYRFDGQGAIGVAGEGEYIVRGSDFEE